MKTLSIKNLAALAAIGVAGIASAQSTFDLASVPASAQTAAAAVYPGNPLGAAGATYFVGSSITINSSSFQVTFNGSFGSEARMELYNSLYPTLSCTTAALFQSGINFTTGLVNGTLTTSALTGDLVGANINNAASNWSYNTYDTFPDNIGGDEGTMSINFTITAGIPPAPVADTLVISGDSVDLEGDPSNTVLTFPSTVADYVFPSTPRRLATGSVTLLNASSLVSHVAVSLRNSAYPFIRTAIGVSSQVGTVNVPLNFTLGNYTLGLPSANWNFSSTLAGCTIPTGSVWTAEIYESTNNGDDVPEASISNWSLQLTPNIAANAAGTAPATFTDLGEINSTTAPLATPLVSAQTAIAAGEVRWFKFSVGNIAPWSGTFIDMYTETTETVAVLDDCDTEFALYRADGTLLVKEGDDSQGFLSAISIGAPAAPRPASPTNGLLTAGVENNGRDMLGLGAGTYYLGVYGYVTTGNNTNHGFNIPVASRGAMVNGFSLKFQTNAAPSAPAAISGNLDLLDTVGSGGTESIGWTLTDGVNSYNGNVSVADVGSSAYSITIPGGAPNGAYTLKFKGGTFLSKTLNVTLTGSSITGQNAALVNGDIDQDTEVGPGDFEAVVAQFGGPGDADVDNDGEVGPSDFETVIANFGLGDE